MMDHGALCVTTAGATRMLKLSAGSLDLMVQALLLLSKVLTMLEPTKAVGALPQAVAASITTTWHALAVRQLWLSALDGKALTTVSTPRMLLSTVP